jgi:hypothetical protein
MIGHNPSAVVAAEQLQAMGSSGAAYDRAMTMQALGLFEKALWRGRLGSVRDRLTSRHAAYLSGLATDMAGKTAVIDHHERGQAILLERVHGSESRSRDFDRDFNPLQTHTRQRWVNVAKAWLEDIPLPAVELIQLGDTYYVRDGHHRISVAKALGQTYIDAEVTVMKVVSAK